MAWVAEGRRMHHALLAAVGRRPLMRSQCPPVGLMLQWIAPASRLWLGIV